MFSAAIADGLLSITDQPIEIKRGTGIGLVLLDVPVPQNAAETREFLGSQCIEIQCAVGVARVIKRDLRKRDVQRGGEFRQRVVLLGGEIEHGQRSTLDGAGDESLGISDKPSCQNAAISLVFRERDTPTSLLVF